LQLAAKSARRADESPFWGALSGLTLTKMRSILRQPKANFAIAKFGLKDTGFLSPEPVKKK
jgi:hypothetical protein